jgi:5'/3'-nucleotidase SurE
MPSLRPLLLRITLTLALALAQPAHASLCGTGPLDILLTNDDGYQAAGIRALYVKLRAAGHRVLLVAPDRNFSGSSISFTWGEVEVARDPSDPNVFAVRGTPSTAVALGAKVLYPSGARPDLIVSGINTGANTGSLLALSGTVGAALAGTMLLDPPVPGLAISAERPRSAAPQALPADHLDQVAAHAAALIAATRPWFCKRGEPSRARTVLNVNYPALPVTALRGTVVASQGHSPGIRVRFESSEPGVYTARPADDAATTDARDSDVARLEQGYVTVTPIEARLDDRKSATRDLQQRLRRLRP